MAHSLGMSTTAEGVETLEQLEIVKTEGCTEIQGFLFSPALPASEIDKILSAASASACLRKPRTPHERKRLERIDHDGNILRPPSPFRAQGAPARRCWSSRTTRASGR